jgi:toxin HigB-1
VHIGFANKKLEKLANHHAEAVRKLGPVCAKRLLSRMRELGAATCLEDIRSLPQARCHELRSDRAGQLSLDLEHPLRLIIKPNHSPPPNLEAGGLDWRLVTKITVIEITDTHG